MHKIELKYRQYWWNKIKIVSVPESWNELSGKQFIKVIELIHNTSNFALLKLLLTKFLFRLDRTILYLFTNYQMVQAQELVNFIWKEKAPTDNLLPKIRVFFSYYYGPGDRLSGMSAMEWARSEYYYNEFKKTKDDNDLNCFIACLYRPKVAGYNPVSPDFNGEIRQKFNPHHVEKNALKFKKVGLYTKLAILHWYDGCRLYLEETFDLVFTEKTKTKARNYGWEEVFMQMSGSTFGKLDEVINEPIFNILLKMQVDANNHQELQNKKQ